MSPLTTKDQPWSIMMTDKAPGKAKIKIAPEKEEWLYLSDRAELVKNKIPIGARVQFSLQGGLISSIFEVDENGNRISSHKNSPKREAERESLSERESLKNQLILCECFVPHAVEVTWMALEKGLDEKTTAKLWEDVLNMAMYGMKRIMGSAEVKTV